MSSGIVIADQSPSVARAIAAACAGSGVPVLGVAHDGVTAVSLALELRPAYVTVDLILPRLAGLQVIEALARHRLGASIVVISAVTAREPIVAAQHAGAIAYILKPFAGPRLVEVLRRRDQAAPQPGALGWQP